MKKLMFVLAAVVSFAGCNGESSFEGGLTYTVSGAVVDVNGVAQANLKGRLCGTLVQAKGKVCKSNQGSSSNNQSCKTKGDLTIVDECSDVETDAQGNYNLSVLFPDHGDESHVVVVLEVGKLRYAASEQTLAGSALNVKFVVAP